METSKKKTIQEMLEDLESFPFVFPDKLPAIPLYMDQVTSMMEELLSPTKRSKKDKLLTKTMINNYAKNHLLPPPAKKKYGREHILMLAFIYYFKGFLSLQDIQSLLEPLWKNYPGDEEGRDGAPDIREIYKQVYARKDTWFECICSDILRSYEESRETFPEYEKEDREFLCNFYLICTLGAEIYLRKRVMEELIDQL